MPFPYKQLQLLLSNLWGWRSHFAPCQAAARVADGAAESDVPPSPLRPRVDLVMYMSRRLNVEEVERRINEELASSPARLCFGRVRFASADLLESRDRYGPAAPDQFYKLWDGRFLDLDDGTPESRYDYIFYMEPDTRPIQRLWLEKVYQEANDASPFWVKGSIGRYGNGERPHMNGNSLYVWNNHEFAKYARDSDGAFTEYASFDQSLYTYMEKNKWYHLYHYFHFTDFIQNLAHTAPPVDEIVAKYPNTVVVHGKGIVKRVAAQYPSPYDDDSVVNVKEAKHQSGRN